MNQQLIQYYKDQSNGKAETTIQFFEKDEFYCFANDAVFLAGDYFKSNSVLKTYDLNTSYIKLSKIVFDQVIKFILLNKHYRIEHHSLECGEWILKSKASPGNISEYEDVLNDYKNPTSCCLCAVLIKPEKNICHIGFACIDYDNRDFKIIEFVDDECYTNLESLFTALNPKECLIQSNLKDHVLERLADLCDILLSPVSRKNFNTESIQSDIEILVSKSKCDSEIYSDPLSMPNAMASLFCTIDWLNLLSEDNLVHKFSLSKYPFEKIVRLDFGALKALNLIPDPLSSKRNNKSSSIYGLLNNCCTVQGQKLLSMWIHQPITDLKKLNERYDIVDSLLSDVQVLNTIREDFLPTFPDMNYFTKKLLKNQSSLKDCYKMYCSFYRLSHLVECLNSLSDDNLEKVDSYFINPLENISKELQKYQDMIKSTVDFEKASNGEYIIRSDFNSELSNLYKTLSTLEVKYDQHFKVVSKEIYGGPNKSLKMEYSSDFGFFFRITLKEEKQIRGNKDYEILETSKSGIKFIKKAMFSLKNEYLEVMEEYKKSQKSIVDELLSIAYEYTDIISKLNSLIAQLDVFSSFAIYALNSPNVLTRPEIFDSNRGFISFKEMRHPLLEINLEGCVIPNDVKLDKSEYYFNIITGPNMGGKSTYIRTAALMVYMAQIGCMIPCKEAKLSIVDAILVRIGADDNISKGISTFMAEMIDSSSILRNATQNSLVIVDELGRGTSTYDGLGLTWAISKYLHDSVRCYTLFATHFHEMTDFPKQFLMSCSYHSLAIESPEDGITMLFKVEKGVQSNNSFGINVARIAGFPENVLSRAAIELENQKIVNIGNNLDKESIEACKEIEKALDFLKKSGETNEDTLEQEIIKIKEQFKHHDNNILRMMGQ